MPLKLYGSYDIINTAAEECLIFVCLQKFAVGVRMPFVTAVQKTKSKILTKEGFLIMASNSKKAVALVLAAMMAATALAGCGASNSGGSTQSTAPSTDASADASADSNAEGGDSSVAGGAPTVDVDSEDVQKQIKDAIAQEAEATGNKISMTLWCSGDDLTFEKSLVEKFKEKYADSRYKITIRVTGAIGEDNAGGKIIESPKDGADVFNFADDQLSSLVEAKAIAKVADLFNENVKANNSEDSVAVCSYDGTPYAFPKTSDNGYFLYYDKRVYKDEKAVASFDEMIKTAKAANKSVYFNLGNGWYSTGVFFTAGCTVEYKDGKQTATYDTKEGLSAAKAMCHLAENAGNGFVGSAGSSGDNATVQQGFSDGSYAAAVIGTWMAPAIKKAIGDENVGAAKLPTILMDGEQKQLHSFGGYKIIGVNSFSKYPTTAQALAYFLSTKDSQVERYNTRGLIPTNSEALASDEIKNDPALKAIEAQKPYAHPQGSSVGGKYWASNIAGFGNEIVTAKGKISDADLEKKLKDLVTQFAG